jgi:hypothetical protein
LGQFAVFVKKLSVFGNGALLHEAPSATAIYPGAIIVAIRLLSSLNERLMTSHFL